MNTLLRCAPAFLVLLPACGPGPVPIEEDSGTSGFQNGAQAGPAQGAMPNDSIHAGLGAAGAPAAGDPGMDPHGMDPHGVAGGTPENLAGVLRLRGALAVAEDAFLFVSVMPKGTNSPACFARLALDDDRLPPESDGERIIPFEFPGCSAPPGEIDLKVQFDVDGVVETKDERTVIRRFPIQHGDQDIDVVLDDRDDSTDH